MTREGANGSVTRWTALETFAGTGAAPTDRGRPLSGRRSRDRAVLIDVDVPLEHVGVKGGVGTIERASLTVTDVAFDTEIGVLARGRLTVGGTGSNNVTWLCNRPFETKELSLSLPGSGSGDLSVSLAPVDLGDHGVVTLAGVPAPFPDSGRTTGRSSVTSLLRAVAALSE